MVAAGSAEQGLVPDGGFPTPFPCAPRIHPDPRVPTSVVPIGLVQRKGLWFPPALGIMLGNVGEQDQI